MEVIELPEALVWKNVGRMCGRREGNFDEVHWKPPWGWGGTMKGC